MRPLTKKEIGKFSWRKGVRGTAVENFLSSMGTDYNNAILNLERNAKQYDWNAETVQAIRDGIDFAEGRSR